MERISKETATGFGLAATIGTAALLGWHVYQKHNEKKCKKQEKKPTVEDVIIDPDQKAKTVEEIQKNLDIMENSHKFSNAFQEAAIKTAKLARDFFGK